MVVCKITDTFRKDFYERLVWKRGELVVGIDEVGRGCLAGPVVAAAVVLRSGFKHELLRDSKLLTRDQLEEAFAEIVSNSWYGIGIAHHRMIDQKNIYRASQWAMERALAQAVSLLKVSPGLILIDAVPLDERSVPCDAYYFIKGESRSRSIAAASIVAKVARDRIMENYHEQFPGFLLHDHKGYATAAHRAALGLCGSCLIHRITFQGVQFHDDIKDQAALC